MTDEQLIEAAAVLPPTRRACGDCNLCCKLLPVIDIQKPRNQWCPHVKFGHGCGIYADRPRSCRIWSCGYLLRKNAPEALKPNRCHVVIDMMTDTIWDNGKAYNAMQIWVDPAYPDAHRAPVVRAEILLAGETLAMPTLARITAVRSVFIVPPPLSDDGTWFEKEARIFSDPSQQWEMDKLGVKLPPKIITLEGDQP